MKVRILPSAPGAADGQYLVTFLVNGALAVDAGCLGLQGWENGAGPADVFLTHSHLDHLATLPLYLEDRHDRGAPAVRVHGPVATLEALRANFFNEAIWVDEMRLCGPEPWVELCALEPGLPVRAGHLRVTAVPVNHTVPTCGYLVEDEGCAVLFAADSGATERLWEVAGACGNLRAVFLECSFPDSHAELARRTGHLAPRHWPGELARLPAGVRVIAVHLKPRFRDRIVSELEALADPRVSIGIAGPEYAF